MGDWIRTVLVPTTKWLPSEYAHKKDHENILLVILPHRKIYFFQFFLSFTAKNFPRAAKVPPKNSIEIS